MERRHPDVRQKGRRPPPRPVRLATCLLAALLIGCASTGHSPAGPRVGFPDFITANEDYFTTRIDGIPAIDAGEYRLEVKGLVSGPRSFTLEELRGLPMKEIPLTVECIGNSPGGPLISTARWRGFVLYDLLLSLGLDERATGVRYRAADGYHASHTMEQVRDNGVMGALYMNGVDIPPRHGFPLRILNPGYYGVKQPAWVTGIEVIDRPVKDYWEDRGWDCSPPMAVDSTIFFPGWESSVSVGETLTLGGAAFGGRRIAKVEITDDAGVTWKEAEVVRSLDADNVWVFWKASVRFDRKGEFRVHSRATDVNGGTQPENDPSSYDGTGDWPFIEVTVR